MRSERVRIELLTIGDELLDGVVRDDNAAWMARALESAGHRVARVTTVPDDPAALEAAFTEITVRADVCISSGGLGPTEDDRTVDALLAVAGVGAEHDAAAWAHIAQLYGDRPIPEINRRQARRPIGGSLLPTEVGTAPGVDLIVGRCRVFCVPGVPREMRWHLERHVLPAVGAGPRTDTRRVVRVALIGESTAADRLAHAGIPSSVAVAWRALGPENEIKLRGPAADVDAAVACVRAVLPTEHLDPHPDLAHATLAAARAVGATLGAAESCTGGLVAAALTAVPGASASFSGSVVAYANPVKQQLLGVPVEVLRAHGAVSEACARAMAHGARRALGVDFAVSITGIAGPGGGTAEKPVGTVCFGWAGPELDRVVTHRLRGDRARVRQFAVAHALDGLRRALTHHA